MDVNLTYDKVVEAQLELIKTSLSGRNYEILKQWTDHSIANHLSTKRTAKLLQMTRQMALFLNKDLDTTTKDDIQRLVTQINQGVLPNRMEGKVYNYAGIKKERYMESTRQTYKIVLKSFYKWLEGENDFYPEKVRWLKKGAIAVSHKAKTEYHHLAVKVDGYHTVKIDVRDGNNAEVIATDSYDFLM